MILLLSLALAAAIYLSTFIATEHNRIQDISNYQVGADFSGQITATNTQQSLQTLQAHYASMPGVTSATLGYNETIQGNQNIQTTIVNAVNANTYAQSAIWSSAYTTQSLQSLMKELSAHRSSAIAKNEVYAIADPQTWQMLGLAPGAVFTLATDDPHFQNIHFIAMTEANYLPGLQDSDIGNTNPTMLIDYQNYAAVYAQDNHGAQLQPNYLWLSTRNDAHSLSQVRQEFPTLQDRRALIEQATNEPLQTAITGTLILGLIISFFLILIGVGLTAWTSVKQRRTSFSILRALGMTPGQITRILLWEQSFTYLAALAIGLFIGWISTFFIVSAYALVDHLLQAVSVVFDNIGLPLQKSAAIPITWFSLMLAIFVLICGATLLLVSYYGTRPALGQALRINED
jgi:ABC-type antimicrobial peptide transport system permease subunit